jgi:hypothetical protein
VNQSRSSRLGATFLAIFAIATLAVLPVAHAHMTVSGQTLVHTHLTPEPTEHSGTLDHGDHDDARSLAESFTIEPTLQIDAPALIEAVVLAPLPEPTKGYVEPAEPRPIHGPPIRAISLRAPPA